MPAMHQAPMYQTVYMHMEICISKKSVRELGWDASYGRGEVTEALQHVDCKLERCRMHVLRGGMGPLAMEWGTQNGVHGMRCKDRSHGTGPCVVQRMCHME